MLPPPLATPPHPPCFPPVFVDQAYWMGAIASKPSASYKGYILGGLMWFSIPFTLATSLGLASVALDLPLTKAEAGSGLVSAAAPLCLCLPRRRRAGQPPSLATCCASCPPRHGSSATNHATNLPCHPLQVPPAVAVYMLGKSGAVWIVSAPSLVVCSPLPLCLCALRCLLGTQGQWRGRDRAEQRPPRRPPRPPPPPPPPPLLTSPPACPSPPP